MSFYVSKHNYIQEIQDQEPADIKSKWLRHVVGFILFGVEGVLVGAALKISLKASMCLGGAMALGCGGAILGGYGLQYLASKKLLQWKWAFAGTGTIFIALPAVLAVAGVASGIFPISAGYALAGTGLLFSTVPIGLAFMLNSTKIFSPI